MVQAAAPAYDVRVLPTRYPAMIKGLILCFACLFAQLVALQYLDHRLNGGPGDARPPLSSHPAVVRDEEQAEADEMG